MTAIVDPAEASIRHGELVVDQDRLKHIVEAALMAAGEPVAMERLLSLFDVEGGPTRGELSLALEALQADYSQRGIELVQVASGFRVQVRRELTPWIGRLWEEKPPRYSRALLETLALIAYRQPVTRGEIEEVRGVAVSTHIVRTLLERGWVRIVGHRDVPGRPALYATTKEFLDYFNLSSLAELPALSEVQALVPEAPQTGIGVRPQPETEHEGPSPEPPQNRFDTA